MQPRTSTNTATRERVNIAGIGRVLMWTGGSLWIGRNAGRSTMHSHHAIQLAFALGGHFDMKSGRSGAWRSYTAALVRPNERHQFDGLGTAMAQVFVEPETAEGRALLALHPDGDVLPLAADKVRTPVAVMGRLYAERADDAALVRAAQACVNALAGRAAHTSPRIDARIEEVLHRLRGHLAHPVSLADAAAWVHLSPSRFRHLFADHVGASFRAYLLWLRLNAAVEHAMAGATWTESAHHAGFADSSHLSRTFRRMFGFVPVMLIKE